MTDPDRDRGAYTPSGEGPFAFDARDARERGAGRPPTTLIISAVVLLVLVLALFFYYRSGVRRSGEPPVVGAPLSDIRQAPPSSAQTGDAAAGLQVYSAGQPPPPSAAPAAFAPAPEEPLPRGQASSSPSAPSPPASSTLQAAALRPAPAAPAPAPPKPATPALTANVPSAGPLVQIGAFSSLALADKGWNDVARLLPGDMAGRTKKVEPVSKDTSTLYRASVGGFASKSEATAFCDELKQAGHACMVK